MISYEDLCQTLDRVTARRRNEQEMANLEGAPEELAAGDVDMSAAQVAADFAASVDQPQEEPEASVEGDLDAYAATAEAPVGAEEPPAPEAEFVAAAGDGFADQAPEDTHEIDVDDVLVEDRLSDDKLPGD